MDVQTHIKQWKEFLQLKYYSELLHRIHQGEKSLNIDFAKVAEFNPELADALLEDYLDSSAACSIAFEDFGEKIPYRFTPRFFNLPKSCKVRVKDIRTNHLNKFVTIEAVIRQSSEVRPMVLSSRYECPSCGNIIPIMQLDKTIKEPTHCGCGRKGKFKLVSEEKTDCQRLKIEDLMEDLKGNEQGRQLNVLLTDNLTEVRMDQKNTPGAKIRITGLILDIPIQGKNGEKLTDKELFLKANFVETLSEDYDDVVINKEEVEKIKEFSKSNNIVKDLVASYAPSIEGYDDIKLAIILQQFGAVKKTQNTIKRGDFHVLLIGDPSTAKSVLIKYVSNIAPKSRYSAGPGSSGKGLTASVEKDDFIGGWCVRAGALVLANKGVLAVDEIDKMADEDRRLIHEALEQQTISIDRASVHVTLQSETSMLAAGNPKYSRFDPYSPLADQIEIEDSLLSRFDLIFFIRDQPQKDKDAAIICKIVDAHQEKENICPLLDNQFVKKYIAYAKRLRPLISQSARDKIISIYLKIRDASKDGTVSITARKGEGLIRLSEAAAKMRLSNCVEACDVELAERVFMSSYVQMATDPATGKFDVDRMESKVTSSGRNTMHVILDYIKSSKEPIHINDIEQYAEDQNIPAQLFEQIFDRMKRMGEVIESKARFYKYNDI